jgi:hypothetical protein
MHVTAAACTATHKRAVNTATAPTTRHQQQCGETTFELHVPSDAPDTLALRLLALPMLEAALVEPYPNVIAESITPTPLRVVSPTTAAAATPAVTTAAAAVAATAATAADCSPVATRQWTLPARGRGQNGIDFAIPQCMPAPGAAAAWTTALVVKLSSAAPVDVIVSFAAFTDSVIAMHAKSMSSVCLLQDSGSFVFASLVSCNTVSLHVCDGSSDPLLPLSRLLIN